MVLQQKSILNLNCFSWPDWELFPKVVTYCVVFTAPLWGCFAVGAKTRNQPVGQWKVGHIFVQVFFLSIFHILYSTYILKIYYQSAKEFSIKFPTIFKGLSWRFIFASAYIKSNCIVCILMFWAKLLVCDWCLLLISFTVITQLYWRMKLHLMGIHFLLKGFLKNNNVCRYYIL